MAWVFLLDFPESEALATRIPRANTKNEFFIELFQRQFMMPALLQKICICIRVNDIRLKKYIFLAREYGKIIIFEIRNKRIFGFVNLCCVHLAKTDPFYLPDRYY